MIQTVWGKTEFKGYYVSINGQVASQRTRGGYIDKNKWLILGEDTYTGYSRQTFSVGNEQNRQQTHRTVAKTFIPKIVGKPHVNHIDGNPLNNKIENLEWCTPQENEQHSWNVLGKQVSQESKLARSAALRMRHFNDAPCTVLHISKEEIYSIWSMRDNYSMNQISLKLNIHRETVTKILNTNVVRVKKGSRSKTYEEYRYVDIP